MTSAEKIRKIFAENIRRFRIEKGWTQDFLAEKIGMSVSYVTNIERARSGVSDSSFAKFCNVFHKKPADFYSSADAFFESDRELQLCIEDSISKIFENSAHRLSQEILEDFHLTLKEEDVRHVPVTVLFKLKCTF